MVWAGRKGSVDFEDTKIEHTIKVYKVSVIISGWLSITQKLKDITAGNMQNADEKWSASYLMLICSTM